MNQQSERDNRAQIVQVCQLMYQKGFICASDGNVSVRLSADRILITPSGLHKGLITPEQLLIVDGDGGVVRAPRGLRPTSELPMHLEAYKLRPDIGAVVHAHPPITVALSIAGVPLDTCLLPEVIIFLGLIPVTEYAMPSSEENARAIRGLIGDHDGLVLQRHGSLTVGADVMQAFMRLETLEQQARMTYMLSQLGGVQPMPPHEIRKLLQLRDKMGLSHAGEAAEFAQLCGVDDAPATAGPDAEHIRRLVTRVVQQSLGNTKLP